jgi:L-2-hydroxycarboxylate dehydrogenase (NAD+)
MRVDAFRPADEFKSHMDNWITRFRSAKTVEGEGRVIIPGDPEREMANERMKLGVPVNEKVVKDLEELGQRFKISLV